MAKMIWVTVLCALASAVAGEKMCIAANYTMDFQYQKVSQQTNSAQGDGGGILVTGDGAVSLTDGCVNVNEYWHLNATYLQFVAYYAWANNSYLFNPLTGQCSVLGESCIILKCWDYNQINIGEFGSNTVAILSALESEGSQNTHFKVIGLSEANVIEYMYSSVTYQTDTNVISEYATNNITTMIVDRFVPTRTSHCQPPPQQCLSAGAHPDAAFHRGHLSRLVRNMAPGATLKHKDPIAMVRRDPMDSHTVPATAKSAPIDSNATAAEVCPALKYTTAFVGGNELAGASGILRYEDKNGIVNARIDESINNFKGEQMEGTVFSLNGRQHWVTNGTCSVINVPLPIHCLTGIRETKNIEVMNQYATAYSTYYAKRTTPEYSPDYALASLLVEGEVPLTFVNFTAGLDNGNPYGKTSMILHYLNYTNDVDSSFFTLPAICNANSPEAPLDVLRKSTMFRALFRV